MVTEKNPLGNFKTLYLKFDNECKEKHQLFFKEHSVRNQEAQYPKGRTLFLLNVPHYATVDAIKKNFTKQCGPVKGVKFNSSSGGSKSAYIVFSNETGLDKALSLPKDKTFILNDDDENNTANVGLKKWINEYNNQMKTDEKSLKLSIEEYMMNYDQQNDKSVDKSDKDDDGWTTVSSKKKRGQFATQRKKSTIDKIIKTENRKDKKKKLVNFYTFQIREAKKQEITEMRKKYELDKLKIEKMKAQRTFKPFT
ncbi:hypothetical protein HCN44_002150 [Aphidius gifuensis]|uniref:RRM domain-containing protein n=1 Tax=Aphidius gifuensis TaxID=684658 RepID=A0A834Y2H4_APHGI|nr:ribosomal RNA-processing protein 7 homolog A [Aphidius gifuensis]KAF7996518.1 hypothetical protein HCN44_002150 [Aphidius gifuensis]